MNDFMMEREIQEALTAGEKEPMALMGLLAVLVYGAHNFFCYQQVCCIPFLFLLIAMSENLVREAAEK